MDNLQIRKATRQDCKQVMDMRIELAAFSNMTNPIETTVEMLEKDGFDTNPPCFQCLVAEQSDVLIGYALFFHTYSTSKGGRLLFLEDLYIKQKYRSKGYGRKLFEAVATEARRQNIKNMEWCVLNWNDRAIDFYKNLGGLDLTQNNKFHIWGLTLDDSTYHD